MMLQLPPQCLDMILDSLTRDDMLSLSMTCKLFNKIIMSRLYCKIYYLPGYSHRNDYTIINNEVQLRSFLRTNKRFEFEFINLSCTKEIDVDDVTYDLDNLGTSRKDELYIPFQIDEFPTNFDQDYLKFFKNHDDDDALRNLKTLSIVIKNDQSQEEFELILEKIDSSAIRNLELIIIDNGEELTIFKTALLFVKHFNLNSLSIMYFCHKDDNKNNLRILLLNSIILNLKLSKLFIYLDLANLKVSHLYLLYRQLDQFEGYVDFNMNLQNFVIDFLSLKDVNFFKNFIHNSSIVTLIFEELVGINKEFSQVFKRLNSNLKKHEFNYILDYQGKFLFCNYFLKGKIQKRHVKLFEIEYHNNEITNIVNFDVRLSPNFESDLNDISSIFS